LGLRRAFIADAAVLTCLNSLASGGASLGQAAAAIEQHAIFLYASYIRHCSADRHPERSGRSTGARSRLG